MDVVPDSTDVTTYFSLRLSATGANATGLTITELDLQYVRSGDTPAAKVDATALAATNSAHGDNKAIEIDATDQPGLYRVDWPDAAFAAGVREVILSVKHTTTIVEHLRVNLTPVPADVRNWLGTAAATPTVAGVPEVDVTHAAGVTAPITNFGVVFNTDFAVNYNTTVDGWVVKLGNYAHGGTSSQVRFKSDGAVAGFLCEGNDGFAGFHCIGYSTGANGTAGAIFQGGGGSTSGGPGVSFIGGAGTPSDADGGAGVSIVGGAKDGTGSDGHGVVISRGGSGADDIKLTNSDAPTLEAVIWNAAIATYSGTAGSTAEQLAAAGAAGDPWATALPGAYGAGTAGRLVGRSLPDVVAGAAGGLFIAGSNAATTVATWTITGAMSINGTGNVAQTGDSFARLGAPAGASIAADLVVIDNFVDDLESRLGTPSNLGSGATIAANLVDIESQTDDIGAAGAGLTAADDAILTAIAALNNISTAQVNAEVDAALADINLDHLMKIAVDTDFATTVHVDSALGQVVQTADGGFARSTDSLEAIRDRGDAAWITSTFSITAAAIASQVRTELSTELARIDVATSTRSTVTTAQVNTEVDAAIETYGLDHLVSTSVAGADVADNSIIAKLVSKSATADWDSFTNTTDALEALRDNHPANFSSLAINASGHISRVTLTDTLTTYTGNTPQTGDSYAIVSSGTHGNAALKTLIDAVDDLLDTEVAAIKSDTAEILDDTGSSGVVVAAASKTGYSLAAAGLDSVLIESGISAGAGLTNDTGTQLTSINARQAIALAIAALNAVLAGAATTNVTIKPAGKPAGNTRVDATVDSSGNRTAVNLKVPD
jgi:hypothetical protein